MNPVSFDLQTIVLNKPVGMTDEECAPLPVFSDGKECVSCWELSDEELADIVQSKRIWLRVLSGQTQPPVALQTEYPL